MSGAEPAAWTRMRRKRMEDLFPTLSVAEPSSILKVDTWGVSRGAPVTDFSQAAMSLARRSVEPEPSNHDDVAPSVRGRSQGGSWGEPPPGYGASYDEGYAPSEASVATVDPAAPRVGFGTVMEDLDRPLGAVQGALTDISDPVGGLRRGFESPEEYSYRDVGPIRVLPDDDNIPVNPLLGPLGDIVGAFGYRPRVSAQDIASTAADLTFDPLNLIPGIGRADDTARLLGRGGRRTASWMAAVDQALNPPDLMEIAPEAFQRGRGVIDLIPQGTPGSPRRLRGAALPEDLIPRQTVIQPQRGMVSGLAGGADVEDIESLVARKMREGLTPQQAMNDPEVQSALARVFRPDYNAQTAGAGADDIAKNLQRARNQESRIASVANNVDDPLARFDRSTDIAPPKPIAAERIAQIRAAAQRKASGIPEGGPAGGAPLPGEAGYVQDFMGRTSETGVPSSGRATVNDTFTPAPNAGTNTVDAFARIRAQRAFQERPRMEVPEGSATESMFGGMEPPKAPRNWGDTASNIVNFSTSAKSTYDVSAPGRQLAPMLYAHPTAIPRVLKAQFKAFSGESFAQQQARLRTAPHAAYRDLAGVELGDLGTDLTKREENIGSVLAEKVLPGSKNFNQAYTAAINEGRDWLFRQMLRDVDPSLLTEAGLRNGGAEELRRIGKLVNASTGRGSDLGGVLRQNKILGIPAFWAPRLFVGRVQLPLSMASKSPAVRKEAARQTLAFVGVNTALLALVAKSGVADVELDPRSSDFGQIRIGDRRYDVWAGYRPIANLVGRLSIGIANMARDGKDIPNMKTIEGDFYSKRNIDVVTRFLRGKLSPIGGEAASQSTGRDLSGRKVEDAPGGAVGHAVLALAAPIFLESLIEELMETVPEGFEEGGATGAAKQAAISVGANAPYFTGVGGGFYGDETGTTSGPSGQSQRPVRPQRPTRPKRPARPTR